MNKNSSTLRVFFVKITFYEYCDFIYFSLVSIFKHLQKLRCSLTFEFIVLILADDFSLLYIPFVVH